MTTPPLLTTDAFRDRVSATDAIEAITNALRGVVDPAEAPPPSRIPVESGDLRLTSTEAFGFTGMKLLSVAPDNPRRKLPRVQGVYVLMDSATLTPRLLLDAASLTQLRTAAVSAAAVDVLADPSASRLVVFGSGSLAKWHIEAMMAIRPIERVVIIARDGYKAEGLAAWSVERGLQARIGQAVPANSAVPDSDIVVCATSSIEPVFDGELVPPSGVVVAVGSHDRGHRELDASLLGRSDVYVEDRELALHEAGEVIMAVEEGVLDPASLHTLGDLVRGARRTPDRPAVVKTVGMAWQDLVLAIAAHEASPRKSRTRQVGYRYPHGGIARSRR